MPCPLYHADPRDRCDAVVDEVTPTLHERERFCSTHEYGHCPTLRTMLRLGRPLRDEEYLANWLPPSPDEEAKGR
jgi:hypothetical protein